MTIPIINISATNIEQSAERQALIRQKLAPLGRLLVHEREVEVDVNIRRLETGLGGGAFYVAINVRTDRGNYTAIAKGLYLTRVLSEAREELRKSLSRGTSVANITFGQREVMA